ncbi:MAG: M48 family metallopeptidase [Rhodospirillaceae bacterium]|nr:M48 family metallopeptidase [Rhodospirillaceae bacterium]
MCICGVPHGTGQRGSALGRRSLLRGAGAAAAAVGVAGCAQGGFGGGGGIGAFGEAAAPLLVPPDVAADMGSQLWAELHRTEQLSRDGTKQSRLQRVGSRVITAAGGNPGQWQMAVFVGEEANAFALPGNYIGAYEGIFAYAPDDAELATVLGHEVAHVLENHPAERVATAEATGAGISLIGQTLSGGNPESAQQIAAVLGLGAQVGLLLPYSREQELEADRRGLMLMAQAGYDPRAALSFWHKMDQSGSPQPPEFASTHPAPGNRIAQLEQMMPDAMRLYGA